MTNLCRLEADVLARPGALDSATLAKGASMIGVGEPTDAMVQAINSRFALRPMEASEVFVWPIQAVNNLTTAYHFWMDRTSLVNFDARANTGAGISYLRNHNQGEDPHGRVFAAKLFDDGEYVAPKLAKGAVPLARDVFRPKGSDRVLRLIEMVYMPRGLTINGHANDDLIANIEAGVQASVSIGFSYMSPQEPGSSFIDDITGLDLFRSGTDQVPYFPGVDYEVDGPNGKKMVVTATARVVGAQQNEVSGVYFGAVPDAYVERGAALFREGRLALTDARRIEETMGLRHGLLVGDLRTYSLPAAPATAAGEPRIVHEDDAAAVGGDAVATTDTGLSRLRELVGSDAARWADLELEGVEADPIGALVTLHRREIDEARAQGEALGAAHEALKAELAERLGLAEGETLADGIGRLKALAATGEAVRGELIKQLFVQMTRAGMPPADEDSERELIASWTPDQLRAKTEAYKRVADQQIQPGRVSEPALSLVDRHAAAADNATNDQPAPRRVARV